jgi:hypothetical protein
LPGHDFVLFRELRGIAYGSNGFDLEGGYAFESPLEHDPTIGRHYLETLNYIVLIPSELTLLILVTKLYIVSNNIKILG